MSMEPAAFGLLVLEISLHLYFLCQNKLVSFFVHFERLVQAVLWLKYQNETSILYLSSVRLSLIFTLFAMAGLRGVLKTSKSVHRGVYVMKVWYHNLFIYSPKNRLLCNDCCHILFFGSYKSMWAFQFFANWCRILSMFVWIILLLFKSCLYYLLIIN